MIKNNNKNRGFTLVEIVLYMLIVSVVLFAIMSFSMQIFSANSRSVNMQEIGTNMDFISNKISSVIQNANVINTGACIFDTDIGKISLTVPTVNETPTDIYLENQAIYLKEGNGTATKISSDFIKCTQLKFIRVTQSKTPDMVILDMTCSPVNDETDTVIEELKVHTSISLRR